MYRKRDRAQFYIEDFIMPFGGKLRADNRWVKMAEMIPWDFVEDIYLENMNQDNGAPAISSRIAFGAIQVKEYEKLSDERVLDYICENPYVQYFLGLQEFQDTPLFDSSMMVHFRKRFPADKIEEINKRMFVEPKEDDPDDDPPFPNNGKLLLDATVAESDIRYPTDISLLNESRENLEQIIEELWGHGPKQGHKTRYNRKKARSQYLQIIKQKAPGAKKIKAGIGIQLGYVWSNLETIGELLLHTGLDVLPEKRTKRLMTICELYRQQRAMYEDGTHRCENRIVSLKQPHVRPIVRGKVGKPVEFGQKMALSVVNGYTFIEKQSFDNFNEGTCLIESVERYRRLHGCYPEVVQADRIYRNRDNRAYCKKHGIRISGPRLGRPGKAAEKERDTAIQDNRERNTIEGRNGMAKRRFGLDLIYAYLPETALTEAVLNVLCMNVRIRLLLLRLYRFFGKRRLRTGLGDKIVAWHILLNIPEQLRVGFA